MTKIFRHRITMAGSRREANKWWMARAAKGLSIIVRDSPCSSPIYAPDLASATAELIRKNENGVFNIVNAGSATPKEIAEEVVSGHPAVTVSTTLTQSWFKAPMPKFSVLSTKKVERILQRPLRNWRDAMRECLFKYRNPGQ